MSMSSEVTAYLILGLVDRFNGITDAARAHIEAKKAEGKSMDDILDELQAERQQASSDAGEAVDKMP